MAEHEHHQNHNEHSLWPLAALGVAGLAVAAPFALPAIDLGTDTAALAATNAFHAHNISAGSGLAGLISQGISHVPLVGESLASGGWATILTSGVIGIGGVLLANWMKKHEQEGDFPWSKVIRYGALGTSMLISLPSLLTGIGIGLTFLANFFISDAGSMNSFISSLTSTLGTAPMQHMGSGGNLIASMLPHILGCGASIIPLSFAYFMGRKRVDTPQAVAETPTYHCQLTAPCTPLRGQPCEVAFRLTTSDGRALSDAELAIVHTRPLHTMIVDSSLRDYHHLHPDYDPVRKCFVCHFTPNLQTSYTMWNDFTVKGEQSAAYLHTELGARRGISLPPRLMHTSHVEGAGVAVDIRPDVPLRAGGHHTLTLDIRDAAGRPVTNLEPIMGAYAHLVAFSADGQHFLHIHPLGTEPTSDAARGTSPLHFHVMPQVDGPTQFFLQIQREGKIITLPFGQVVRKEHQAENNGAAMQMAPQIGVAVAAGHHHR